MSNQTPLRFHKFVASHLPPGKTGELLNAGCGTGRLNEIGLLNTRLAKLQESRPEWEMAIP
jgi:hypothetical protein